MEYANWLRDVGGQLAAVPVQIDGRLRDRISIAATAGEGEARAVALAALKVQEALASRAVRRVVIVPGRVINVVTE